MEKARHMLRKIKPLLKPVGAILSMYLSITFALGRAYERWHMVTSEDWVKVRR